MNIKQGGVTRVSPSLSLSLSLYACVNELVQVQQYEVGFRPQGDPHLLNPITELHSQFILV